MVGNRNRRNHVCGNVTLGHVLACSTCKNNLIDCSVPAWCQQKQNRQTSARQKMEVLVQHITRMLLCCEFVSPFVIFAVFTPFEKQTVWFGTYAYSSQGQNIMAIYKFVEKMSFLMHCFNWSKATVDIFVAYKYLERFSLLRLTVVPVSFSLHL